MILQLKGPRVERKFSRLELVKQLNSQDVLILLRWAGLNQLIWTHLTALVSFWAQHKIGLRPPDWSSRDVLYHRVWNIVWQRFRRSQVTRNMPWNSCQVVQWNERLDNSRFDSRQRETRRVCHQLFFRKTTFKMIGPFSKICLVRAHNS